MPVGEYDLGIALIDPVSGEAKVKLAIAGIGEDGWYNLGKITVKE
jgi:hypothetical protein